MGTHNGTANFNTNTKTVDGRINTAIASTTASDYITTTGYHGVTGTSPLSISAWFKTVDGGANNGFFKMGSWASWSCIIVGPGAVSTYGAQLGSTGGYSDNLWHHIVATVTTARLVTLYVDNTYIDSATWASLNIADTTDIRMGAWDTWALNGSMDDVRIFNYALSPADVILLYNAGNGTESHTWIDLSDGLVAHYKMNDNKADYVVVDNTGAYHGTSFAHTTAAMSVAGKIDKALTFNGSTDFVDVGSTAFDFSSTDSWTIGLWFNLTGASDSTLFSTFDAANGYKGYEIEIGTGGRMGFGLNNSWASNTLWAESTTSSLRDGQWHHVVWTYNGTGIISGMKLYLDGSEETLTNTIVTFTPSSDIDSGLAATIGKRASGGNSVTGSIDDVRIYNKVLSPAAIQTLYNQTNGTECDENNTLGDGLVAHYKMNDNAANYDVAENISGYTGSSAVNTTDDMSVAGVSTNTGTALSFNGSTDVVQVDDVSAIATNQGTVSMWVNRGASGTQTIVDVEGSGVTDPWIVLGFNSNNTLKIYSQQSGGAGTASGTTAIGTGVWTNLVFILHYYTSGNPDIFSVGEVSELLYPLLSFL